MKQPQNFIQQYAQATMQRDYLQATGQPVPLQVTARITQIESLAQARLSPAQIAEAQQLAAAERSQMQGQAMAEHDAQLQERMVKSADNKLQDLTHNRVTGGDDGQGLTFDQLQQVKKTGKYTPRVAKPKMNLKQFEAAARERNMSLEQFETAMDSAVHAVKVGQPVDTKLDVDRDTLDAWGTHRLSYGLEKRRIERGEYDEEVEDVELDSHGDMRVDLLDAISQHDNFDPDIDPRSLEEDGMRGDVARAMAAHSE